MSSEIPKIEKAVVETESDSRKDSLAAHAREQEKREEFVRNGGVIVEEPGIANQEPADAQGDVMRAESKEQGRREKFFADLIARFPELTDAQREAVRLAMETKTTGVWSDYDGENTTIKRISVDGNVLTIVFDIEDMYMSVDEKVSI